MEFVDYQSFGRRYLCGEFKVLAFLVDCPYLTSDVREVASNHRAWDAPGTYVK
jgi:hypothetical protein